MEKHLFILLFTGVIPLVLSVPRKYYLIQQGMTWSNAQAYCKANHNDLAIVQSNDNLVRLQYEVQRKQFILSAWIGAYDDINSWRWSLGNEPLGSMRPWCPGEPNTWSGEEQYAVIYSVCWYDAGWYTLLPFVCYDATKTGSQRYVLISTTKIFYDAQAYCRTHYTDLASSRDATENSYIKSVIRGPSWFGLFREGWKWIDKTNFSTISWLPEQPDNAKYHENCGFFSNGGAGDEQCSVVMPFICYSVITGKQQIVKLKVQSNQDVNDPALMASILEQIKQKLKSRMIEDNITVKWREQPDGRVFHKEKTINVENAKKVCSFSSFFM